MLTEETIKLIGLPMDSVDSITILRIKSCLEWLLDNTTLEFDKEDVKSLEKLPACVKLFICRYNELYSKQLGVTSESIAGMSQSFDTTAQYTLLWQLAYELLGKYLKTSVIVTPAKRKWI